MRRDSNPFNFLGFTFICGRSRQVQFLLGGRPDGTACARNSGRSSINRGGAKLKELGVEDNTLVFYSTDNGPHMNSWPDAAMTPFRNEKNPNWEGAYRVPAMVRWPGKIKPGSVSNDIVSHLDWLPTLLAMQASGQPAGSNTQSLRLVTR